LAPFATPALPPGSGAGASSDAHPGRRFSVNVPPAGPTPGSAGPAALASPSPTAGPQQATWSIKQWKKQAEPQRNKTHWDYLLEEMEWLSKDFREERQWKVALARKAVKAVSKWHQDRERSERDGDRSTEVQLKRLAAHISREMREQWVQVERVAQYKHDQRLEAARKESREKQLDFLVGQTARYTDMLTEGMLGAAGQPTEEEEDRHVNTAERVDRQAELAALQAEAEAPLDEAVLKRMEEEDSDDDDDDDDDDDNDDDG